MSLNEKLIEVSKTSFPTPLKEQKDGTLVIEYTVAERKVFLSKKTLTYKAKLRIDEQSKIVKLFETLRESGLGLSSGGIDDVSPGFGFKKESYKISGKEREGSIEELSKLFGKEYKYSFDYSKIRKIIEQETINAGYSLSICLREGSV